MVPRARQVCLPLSGVINNAEPEITLLYGGRHLEPLFYQELFVACHELLSRSRLHCSHA